MDATRDDARRFVFRGGGEEGGGEGGAHFLLFAGKKLREPVAWHGPIVMNTDAQLQQCFRDLRSGAFPPKRVPWDYRRLAAKPRDKDEDL